MGGGIN